MTRPALATLPPTRIFRCACGEVVEYELHNPPPGAWFQNCQPCEDIALRTKPLNRFDPETPIKQLRAKEPLIDALLGAPTFTPEYDWETTWR